MVCKCPRCDGALEYNPQLKKMACPYCGGIIKAEEVVKPEFSPEQEKEIEMDMEAADKEVMTCRIYSCTSCGGELSVNDVEASTFCPYCGQPTIVFSRISKELKPRYIIPFAITKQQAVASIEKRIAAAKYAPGELRNIQMDRVAGIYIPYWLFDVYFRDDMRIKATVGSGGSAMDFVYFRDANCELNGITMEASRNLNDELSIRLEPFDLTQVVPFEPAYLSGFYTDKYDINQQQMKREAFFRAQQLFDEAVMESVIGDRKKILERKPYCNITRVEYALLPVWFLTMRYKNVPYTILVNGQTGKIIGSLPTDEREVKKDFWRTLLILMAFAVVMIVPINCVGVGQALILLEIAFSIIALVRGNQMYQKYKKTTQLTQEMRTLKFVKNRQEES